MRTLQFVRIFLFTCGIFNFSAAALFAQCPTSWTVKDDCGPVLANGGIAPNSPPIFCEGETVTFLNTTSNNLGITKVYMDWGDGVCESYDGNPPFFTHAYDIPDDSCVSVPTSVYFLYMGVEKKCAGNKTSFHYIITPLAVSYKPVANPIAPTTICQDEQAIFLNECNTPSNTTSVWTTGNGVTLNGETFSHVFSTPGNHNVTLTVSNMCGSDQETIEVNVTPTAVANASLSDTSLCLPDAVMTVTNLSLNSIGQQWTITPNNNFIYLDGTGPGSLHPKIKFLQPGNYTLKLTAVGCGSPTWTQIVNVSAPPAIDLDTIANNCNEFSIDPNDYFTPAGGAATSFQWVFPGALPASYNGNNPPFVHFSGIGLHTISFNTSNHCGTASATDSFYIMPPATASVVLSDTALCIPGDILYVTNNSANAESYIWWVTPVPWGGFLNGTGAVSKNPVFGFSNEGIYTIHLKVNGCGNPKWEGTVKVRRKPTATLINPIEDGCFSVTLDPADYIGFGGGQADDINWTFSGGQPGFASGPNPPIVLFPDTGYHLVQAVVSNICGTDTVTEDFSIYAPTVVIATTPKDSLCRSADPMQLQAVPNGGLWSGPGVSSTGVFDPAIALDNGWNQLIYRYGAPGCRIYDTVYVYVMSSSVDAGDPVVHCINAGEITLSDHTPLGGSWTGPGVNAAGVFNPESAGAGIHVLTYTIIDGNGCPNSDGLYINVMNMPAAIMGNLYDACLGVPIDFGTYTAGTTGTSCQWTFGDGGTATSCNPDHTYFSTGTFDVQLIVTNAAGCRDTTGKPIVIHDIPDASFTTDLSEGCADLKVAITNHSVPSGNTSYKWDFGDNQSDTSYNPGDHIYSQGLTDTTYYLELTSTNHCGMTIFAVPITVFPQPLAHFGTNVDEGCTPLTVHFNNISAGNSKNYRWYINGVLTDTSAQLPSKIFVSAANADSIYHIMLIADNDCGIDTMLHDVTVHPNTVVAFAHLNKTTGCAPFTVEAINFSTDGEFASWDFGDGNMGVGDTVQHTYTKGGDYVIHLIASNGCGYDTIAVTITVLEQPEVGFTSMPYVCRGDSLSFINTSNGLAGCYWYFGDGSQDLTTASPFHVYDAPGQYTVTMIGMATATGCPDTISHVVMVQTLPVAATHIDVTGGCEPFTIVPANLSTAGTFCLWDFGDGTTSTDALPTHTYEFDGEFILNLRVVDEFGCSSDTSVFPLKVYPKPDLSFQLKQGPLCTSPITLTFTNTSQNADAYDWAFGNGMASTAVNPEFSMNAGPLDILLSGSNMFGCKALLDTQVNIYSEPMIKINLEQTIGCAPFLVVFENVSYAVNNFNWTFGDGQSSTAANPVHLFDTPGTYNVHLTADNDGICFDSSAIEITVLPSPTADFVTEAVSDTLVPSTGIYNFTDASVGASEWFWDFGDGATSSVQDPTHRYYVNGDKPITLIVTNQYGCRDTARQIIQPDPFGNLFIPNTFSPELGASGAREFRPVGTGLRQYTLEIYATNGQLVWASAELADGQPTEAWDGTFKGELCLPGIYWWKCSAILANGRSWSGMSFDGSKHGIREGKLLLVR